MTYRRDGGNYRLGHRRAHPDIVNYGWLRHGIPFTTEGPDLHEPLKRIADALFLRKTRGHHICEFCGWEDANYGNGEIWLTIGTLTYCLPRMTWHYAQAHRYCLPESLSQAILDGDYACCTDDGIKHLVHDLDQNRALKVPAIKIRLAWNESRYANLVKFSQANAMTWNFQQCTVADGFYRADIHHLPHGITVEDQFELDPLHFPDAITVIHEA